MKEYIEKHMESPHYVQSGEMPERYRNSEGWTDYRIGKHIIFAHRVTDYTAENFRDALHAHAYCEIVFRNEGVVQYISGDRTETPQEGSVIVIPPGTLHTTRLLKPSLYDRHVLYFSREAFYEFEGALGLFLEHDSTAFSGVLKEEALTNATQLLRHIEDALEGGDESAELIAYSTLIELLLLIRRAFSESRESCDTRASDATYLPSPIREIRRYIEEHYASILSIEALAARFYYSREYVTRLFRRYYNLSPGEYLEQCRIREAERRIAAGERIADVCFGVGYRSMSAFSAAFRRIMGKPPSAFRTDTRNIHK